MSKISIIVPIYNVEKYLHRCIDSILVQTFSNFELILVDDGSPDDCGEICELYARRDNRIKVIHKKNGGLSDARNAGLAIATGDFVGFVDSDDYIESDMYEKLYQACDAHSSKISMCGRFKVYSQYRIPMFTFEEIKIWNSKEAIENLLLWKGIDSSVCDKLFSRELFEHIEFPIGKYNEDISIMCSLIHKAEKVVHVGEAKYNYFYRSNSITSEVFSEKKLDLLNATQNVINLVTENYPDLLPQANSFRLKGVIYLLSLFDSKQLRIKHKRVYFELKSCLRINFSKLLFDGNFDNKTKLVATLLLTNSFNLLKKLRSIIGKREK